MRVGGEQRHLFADTEVREDALAICADQDVLRLDITVQYNALSGCRRVQEVQRGQSAREAAVVSRKLEEPFRSEALPPCV